MVYLYYTSCIIRRNLEYLIVVVEKKKFGGGGRNF
jgi:hypothetical protein